MIALRIKEIPGLYEFDVTKLDDSNVVNLKDLAKYKVRDFFSLHLSQKSSCILIKFMLKNKVNFKDCKLSEVDLVTDDLDRLEPRGYVRVKYILANAGVTNTNMLTYLSIQDVRKARRGFGPQAQEQVKAQLSKLGKKMLD